MGKKDFALLKISDVLILFTFFSSRRALRSRIAEMVILIGHTKLLPSDWFSVRKDRRFLYMQDNNFPGPIPQHIWQYLMYNTELGYN